MVTLTEICVQCVHSTHIIQGVLVYCFILFWYIAKICSD